MNCVWVAVALMGANGLAQPAEAPPKAKALKKPKVEIVPKHDPADQPFRCAPMAAAVRCVAIALSTNVNVAFDTELLRTHVAWRGESLNLFSAAYNEAKDRFYCDFNGTNLWSAPPFFPWAVGKIPEQDATALPAGTRFRGISVKGGVTTLLYDLALGNGKTVRVHESPRLVRIQIEAPKMSGSPDVVKKPEDSLYEGVVRRLEIGPCSEDLWFLAQAEMGMMANAGAQKAEWVRLAQTVLKRPTNTEPVVLAEAEGANPLVILRENSELAVFARAEVAVSWKGIEQSVDYESKVWAEDKNDSAIQKVRTTGLQARVWLKIPAHAHDIAVEVVSIVLDDVWSENSPREAVLDPARLSFPKRLNLIKVPSEAFAKLELAKPNMAFLTSSEKDSRAPEPKVAEGDKGFLLPAGDEYYRIEPFPLPKEIELQVNGMDFLPNGDLAVCTWQGDVYIVQQPQGQPKAATYRRFARGLCEPGGLKVINGQIYVVQKQQLTRLVDTDGNGEADFYECISQDWGFTGNYHDFSFGPMVDKDGDWHVLRDGNRGLYEVPYMGWDLKISPDGSKTELLCSGLRSPNGFGNYGPEQDVFMTDNQGNWLGACKLNHLQKNRFYGFPSTYPAPKEQFENPKEFAPPAVWFPYKIVRSASGFETIPDDRFGPFKGQILVGEFQNSLVVRVMLEKVNGEWQGATWPMLKGFGSGVNRVSFGPDGKLYVGGLKNKAWTALGLRDYSLDRVTFSGKTPFEVKEAHARPDGFELTFTQPVDASAGGNADSYDVLQYGLQYHEKYGSPEIDHNGKEDSATGIKVVKATVSGDKMKVRLQLEGWKTGYITMVRCLDVVNAEGRKLRNDTFWYTLNQIPK